MYDPYGYTCSVYSMQDIYFLNNQKDTLDFFNDFNHNILYLYSSLRHNNIRHYKDMILCQASIVYMLNVQDIVEIHMFLWEVKIFLPMFTLFVYLY
jgi:hypothetical protein